MKSKNQVICPYKPNTHSGLVVYTVLNMKHQELTYLYAKHVTTMECMHISLLLHTLFKSWEINVFQNKHINEINSVVNFSQCTEFTACLPITNAVGIHCAIGSIVQY